MSTNTSLGAHPEDLRRLQDTCATVDSGLVVVTAEDPALAFAAAHSAATADTEAVWQHRHRTPGPPTSHDVHLARPSGASWTVDEIQTAVLHPARLRPVNRAHIIVADAHTMTKLAADRALKAVEEPRGEVLFWFCTTRADDLTVTLRSRAARTVHLRPLPVSDRVPALVAAGASDSTAKQILEAAGDNIRLGLAVARHHQTPTLLDYRANVTAVAAGATHPFALANTWARNLFHLARTLATTRDPGQPSDTPNARDLWAKLTPAARSEARALLRTAVHQVEQHLAYRATEDTTPQTTDLLAVGLDACNRARNELVTNAHPLLVLTALAARIHSGRQDGPGR